MSKSSLESLICPVNIHVVEDPDKSIGVYSSWTPSILLKFPTPQKAMDWLVEFTPYPITWHLCPKPLHEPSRFSLSLDDNL